MSYLTPALLRKAANEHLYDGCYADQLFSNGFEKYSCYAIDEAAFASGKGRSFVFGLDYGELLVSVGAIRRAKYPLSFNGLSYEDQQSIRFMLLHFLANFLEDETHE